MFAQQLMEIPFKLWLLLLMGPLIFLLSIICISILLRVRDIPASQIPKLITSFVPHILAGVLFCLMVLMTMFPAHVKDAWTVVEYNKILKDAAFGAAAGAVLAFAYIYWLAPLLETLQQNWGDYVPPGSVLPTLSNSIVIFFIANIILAPLVEETVYRGIAIPLIETHLGAVWSVVLTCLFFGLLHWMGGLWYMILTGVVAGGLFAGLFYLREGIIAPFAAHLTLNVIEFKYAYRIQQQAEQINLADR